MKGVIVAAGYGSRFLPLTKTLPKEMLPLFDKPLIDFILDEFEEAGIKDVVVITSRRKKMLEDYLDREVELEEALRKDGRKELLERIKPRNLNIVFIRQQEMKGTGHALLLAKPVLGKEAFVVAYPDDIVLSKPGLTKQILALHEKTGKIILAVREENENLSRYGVIQPKKIGQSIYVESIVEKPINPPSNLVSIGRYLYTHELLELLEEGFKDHKDGEFFQMDALNHLARQDKVMAYETEGLMLDTGEPYSYLNSLFLYLQNHPTASKVFRNFVEGCSASPPVPLSKSGEGTKNKTKRG